MKQRVETIHDAAIADGEAQLDHLLCIEVRAQFGEELVRDGCHPCTRLREAHDGGLIRAVDAIGQRIVA